MNFVISSFISSSLVSSSAKSGYMLALDCFFFSELETTSCKVGFPVGSKVGADKPISMRDVGLDVGSGVGASSTVGLEVGSLVGPKPTNVGGEDGSAVGLEPAIDVGEVLGSIVGTPKREDVGSDVGSFVGWDSTEKSGFSACTFASCDDMKNQMHMHIRRWSLKPIVKVLPVVCY